MAFIESFEVGAGVFHSRPTAPAASVCRERPREKRAYQMVSAAISGQYKRQNGTTIRKGGAEAFIDG